MLVPDHRYLAGSLAATRGNELITCVLLRLDVCISKVKTFLVNSSVSMLCLPSLETCSALPLAVQMHMPCRCQLTAR